MTADPSCETCESENKIPWDKPCVSCHYDEETILSQWKPKEKQKKLNRKRLGGD